MLRAVAVLLVVAACASPAPSASPNGIVYVLLGGPEPTLSAGSTVEAFTLGR
jgi:hypothetical protein